jgi:hypothetical protein
MAWFTIQNIVSALLGLPLAALGLLYWLPPTLLIMLAVKLGKPEEDIVATVKVLGASLFFPIWMACSVWISQHYLPTSTFGLPEYLFAFSLLGFSGIFGSYFLRQRKEAWEEFMVLVRLLSMKRLRSYLTNERDSLRKVLRGGLDS